VARIYAGILGSLAFLTVLVRTIVHRSATDPALLRAWLSLLAFAAAGYVIGRIAEHTIDEMVKSHIAEHLEPQRAGKPTESPPAEGSV
jgi:hypothetical protein